MEPATLLSKLGCDLRLEDLEREFASCAISKKSEGKKGGKVLWCLWCYENSRWLVNAKLLVIALQMGPRPLR